MDLKVRDVMTPGPIAIEYDEPIAEAARAMRDLDLGALFVVRQGVLYGVVTDRDLVVRGVAGAASPADPVGPLSSTELTGVAADDDAGHAVKLMRERALRRLPVLEDGQVIGMVSLGDLAVSDDEESALAEISMAMPNT